MSESDEYTPKESSRCWHLTETGWVAGSYKEPDAESEVEVSPPANRLKTVRYEVISAPMRGALEKLVPIWEKGRSKKKITELEKRFGTAPNKFFE